MQRSIPENQHLDNTSCCMCSPGEEEGCKGDWKQGMLPREAVSCHDAESLNLKPNRFIYVYSCSLSYKCVLLIAVLAVYPTTHINSALVSQQLGQRKPVKKRNAQHVGHGIPSYSFRERCMSIVSEGVWIKHNYQRHPFGK